MRVFVFACVVVHSLIGYCSSLDGVDFSVAYSSEKWRSELSLQPSLTFAIKHILFYNSTINQAGIESLVSAWENNVRDLSVYIYPCVPSSVYATTYNVPCGSAKEQFLKVLGVLKLNKIFFENHTIPNASVNSFHPSANPIVVPSISPSTQILSASPSRNPAQVNSGLVVLQRMYVNVEDETPNRYFDGSAQVNVQFMTELVNEAVTHGVQMGVYTTRRDWLNVMTTTLETPSGRAQIYPLANSTFTATNPFASLPLWLPRYDGVKSLDFFTPFADWTKVHVKQLSGGSAALRRIGSLRVCTDYKRVTSNDNILQYIEL